MRIALVLVALTYGMASAHAAATVEKWCSDGYDQPAQLILSGGRAELHLSGKTEDLGADGAIWEEKVLFATIDYAVEGTEYKDEKIVIYNDHVFWHCEDQ